MSYSEITENSSIVTVISEKEEEDRSSCTVVFRVLSEIKWKKLIHSILKSSYEDETFGVTVRQEYYLNEEGNPAFVWSMLVWGDLDDAKESLSPILSKRGAPPAPPQHLAIAAPIAAPSRRQYKSSEATITEVPLAFTRGNRNNTGEVVKVREGRQGRKPRAFVEGVKP